MEQEVCMCKWNSRVNSRLMIFLLVFSLVVQIQASANDVMTGSLIEFPALVVSSDRNLDQTKGTAVDRIVENLESMDVKVISVRTCGDAEDRFTAKKDIGAVVIDWDLSSDKSTITSTPADLISFIRNQNNDISIFLMTGKTGIENIPENVFANIEGFIRKNQDTPDFIAGTIKRAVNIYREKSLPPFFKALVGYVYDYKYAWSTPGHAGGLGFLASVPGTAFFDFFGEHILRADLSSSMSELGSILEHEGPAGDAEKEAAKTFGADYTFFVLNGTSTANKMVWHSIVTSGDIVLVDRNCHKSIMHAIIMTRAVPVYLIPTRNPYGIIGPIHMKTFDRSAIEKAVNECALIKGNKKKSIRLVVVTNSTYDGLCYYVIGIKDRVSGLVESIHFDEAWYGYARFHPLYDGRFGMSSRGETVDHPPVYATQSTHKLLAAFSQSSMIHIKNGGKDKIDPERFNEAFLMHESTSPFYPMFASIDVSAKMMSGKSGRHIMDECIKEAVTFRKTMARIASEEARKNSWWFEVWQPDRSGGKPFDQIEEKDLITNPENWTLKAGDEWHGFKDIKDDNILLDPIKVSLLSPGINDDGTMAEKGIPAVVVSAFLRSRGVIPEKTGHYNLLFLFAPGVTKGKTGTLLAKLFAFKEMYDRNALIDEVFPSLAEQYPSLYKGKYVKDLCMKMHDYLKKSDLAKMMIEVYSDLPEQAMLPADAYEQLVKGNVEYVPVRNLSGRTTAVMVVPYPPGIPVMMPGEKFTAKSRKTVDYLAMCEDFDNRFPGFEGEIHGITIREEKDRKIYTVNCLKEGGE